MKSLNKQIADKLALMQSKRGQLEVGKTFIVGLIGIIFLIVFALVFTSQIFSAVPLTVGSSEFNASLPIRSNASGSLNIIASNFGVWASILAFAVIIIILVFAYKVFMRGNSDMSSGSGSY